jgi:hypothetical protein
MIVTLDAFSGRPNPSWRLSEKDAAKVIERVAGRAQALAETEAPSILGPRGFLISASSDDEATDNVPSLLRVGAPGAVAGAGTPGLSVSESAEFSSFLLETGRHVLDADLMSFIEQFIRDQARPSAEAGAFDVSMEPAEPAPEEAPPAESAPAETGLALAPCVIANTPYNPGFWNTPAVQPKNNCYNYAMNWRSDTFAQPGRISGHLYTAINCAAVGAAADWDGCHAYCSGSNKNVALVVSLTPGFIDYHWYRRQKEGFWAHKPGGTAVRNYDNKNRLIDGVHLTPANCDRGPYKYFCGYRYSPTGMRVR